MAAADLSGNEAALIISVLELLEGNNPLSIDQLNELERTARNRRPAWVPNEKGGLDYQPAIDKHSIYERSHAEFFDHLKETKPDLAYNLQILKDMLERYFEAGKTAPPYFASRVAILLRKRKRKDIEMRFLRAWVRHFKTGSRSYQKLVERLSKLEAA